MKIKRYIQGITFFTTPQMYQDVKQASDELVISLGEFLRNIIGEYFKKRPVKKGSKPAGQAVKEVMSDELIKK